MELLSGTFRPELIDFVIEMNQGAGGADQVLASSLMFNFVLAMQLFTGTASVWCCAS